jgi:hypothetical protein
VRSVVVVAPSTFNGWRGRVVGLAGYGNVLVRFDGRPMLICFHHTELRA